MPTDHRNIEATATNTDFDNVTWHDNALYGIRLDIGDPDRGDWHADLVLDIDHIVEWVCDVERGGAQFRIAPATLTFHDATDLRLNIDWGDSDWRVAVHPMSIDRIVRELVQNQQICLDRPYYRWQIELNWPKGGAISFGASNFTQVLRAPPALTDQQCLSTRHTEVSGPSQRT